MNRLLFIIFFCGTLLSCNSDDDHSPENNPFLGNWSGTYVNDETSSPSYGTWEATVHSDNTITGSYIEQGYWQYNASGYIEEDGNVIIGIYEQGSDTLAGQFTGIFTSSGTASGNWQNLLNEEFHGTWVGEKN